MGPIKLFFNSSNAITLPLSNIVVSGFSSVSSFCQRISNIYWNAIIKFVTFLKKKEWYLTAMVLGTLLYEPWQALKAGFLNLANLKKPFNFYDMNPSALTNEHLNKQPILLLHGNYHNQSAWTNLAKKLKLHNLGPIYTVNLPHGDVTNKDYEIIQRKIDEIKAQYRQFNVNIKINLVGHSRGGFLAGRIAWSTLMDDGKRYWSRSDDIGKIIRIGSVLDQEEISKIQKYDSNFRDRIYEITGHYDILETDLSLLPKNRTETIDSGHLGLLYSENTHQRIIQLLS